MLYLSIAITRPDATNTQVRLKAFAVCRTVNGRVAKLSPSRKELEYLQEDKDRRSKMGSMS